LRVDGIKNIEDANEFLDRVFIPKWNKFFSKPPKTDFNRKALS
jgi:hypothetical protein